MGKFKDIWDKSKDGNRAPQRSFLRFAIVITAVFVLFLFIKKDSLVRWVQAGFTLRSQERRIEALKEDNERLDARIHMLSTSRDSLEKFAREEFGFAEPGDDVYLEEE
ncbi:MAG: septum formation initiator family protein [Bacteroidales bacterium]|jgi:cell division protein FtsB|nr:septum formation initiator family protein [Bacteroidales bacterium]MBQ1683695.1 septum formation initiator family protein [Bacteroidales bacterium]MBQ2107887.1 septum formation initiator family protein [Bacteroidales bacterium]MBQ2229493.1 septum formation initiator family protein [Bacteroidales bacterium]MBQ2543591.1 septum formation initiator family protein [Bacteroidales bacterium]